MFKLTITLLFFSSYYFYLLSLLLLFSCFIKVKILCAPGYLTQKQPEMLIKLTVKYFNSILQTFFIITGKLFYTRILYIR